ncbi:MAG TPA: ATP-binding protein [Chloroflexi bacterium]|jgi:DNA helicase HerA-like ATPase|nr:ATP-binding protein [Chloroflexota bacterium]
MYTPIGTTKGPGETPHEYTFIAPDPDQRVKYGEFVYYEAAIDGQPRCILGRVTRREPLRLYPDTFMADPAVPPQAVAELLGFDRGAHDLFEISATVLGYYDPAMGFVNPRVPPRSGAPIYIAPDAMLAEVLCRGRPAEQGSVHIGSLLSRPTGAVPITLDARGFTSTHLAIIASTGAGKSYLAGVILEELMQPHNRAAVLVIDPHAEYDTLVDMQLHEAFACEGYRAEVKVVRPKDIQVRVSSLTLGDLRYLLPNLTDRMHHVLGRAYNQVTRRYRDKWTRGHLKVAIRSGGADEPVTADGYRLPDDPLADNELEDDPTVGALIWRVESVLENSAVFNDHVSLPLDALFRPGQCTVLQLNEIPEREQQIIVATLLRRLNQARMDTVRQRASEGDENYLPYPAFVLIEEAHNYAPANADVVTTQILKQILSEGRKFGVAVGLISQRPGKLDGDVLSQCMTQCIMRIVNPVDQARVAESVESVGRDLLAELPALSKGQVIVAGSSVNTPVMVQVRQRLTQHGAENPDAPAEWRRYFDVERERQRQRDNAAPADTPMRRGIERTFR